MFDLRRFEAQLALRGITKCKLAKMLGIDVATLYRKLKADGNFTRDEINQMIDILGIEDPMNIFFAEKLA